MGTYTSYDASSYWVLDKQATSIILDNIDPVILGRIGPRLETVPIDGLGFARYHINPKKSGLANALSCRRENTCTLMRIEQ